MVKTSKIEDVKEILREYEVGNSQQNVNHYKKVAGFLNRVESYVGDGLTEEQFGLLERYGLKLSEVVGKFELLNNSQTTSLLKSCFERWPSFNPPREWLKSFVACRTENSYRHPRHDKLVKNEAKPFLFKCGCSMVSTEVKLAEKLKIDVLGWGEEGIIGVEVVCSLCDLTEDKGKKIERLKSYQHYCDRLYILTDNYDVFTFAQGKREEDDELKFDVEYIEYCEEDPQKPIADMGGFFDTEESIEIELEKNEKKRDAQCALFLKYFAEVGDRVIFGDNNDGNKHPEDIFKKIQESFAKDIDCAKKDRAMDESYLVFEK